jgi:hypothetical protein
MPLFVPIILLVWLAVAAAAVLLCLAARRSDGEVQRSELAPVIDIKAASLRSRQHSAA